MKCSEKQLDLSFYADSDGGSLGERESLAIRDHLAVCPVCRQAESELRGMRTGLRQLNRIEIPADLRSSIRVAVNNERRRAHDSWLPWSDVREWVRLSFAPYGIGMAASLLVAFTFLTLMFAQFGGRQEISSTSSGQTSIMLARNSSPAIRDSGIEFDDISPADYARSRLDFASESPSINPQGALVAMTKSLVRGDMKDDEVVVVADVFSNGLAQIAEVIEPSSNRRAVSELQKALESEPAFAPFVPTTLENRPESVRVVLKFQSVNVSTRQKRSRTRL